MTAPRNLRVLVVSLGRRGGVTEYGWLMARALARHADVAAISSAYAENSDKWRAFEGERLEVRTFSSPLGLALSFLAVTRFLRIRRFARRFRPDVVYYPGGHAWKLYLDALLPRSARVVYTVHDPSLHPGSDSIPYRLLTWVSRRRADGYVLLSRSLRDAFVAQRKLDPARVTVIPHGVFDDYPAVPGGPTELAARMGIPAAEVGTYILFVGRILPYKGIGTLLQAYGMLAPGDAGPLVIAGSGELSEAERAALGALAGRPIHVINTWLSDADMAGLVGSARFVVLPYLSATQSGVIPLASAFGVPAIAAATGGLVEQVVDGETGFLFPPGDAEALRTLLVRAWSMADTDYRRMSEASQAFATREWGWDGLAQRLLRFCASLAP